LKTFDIRIIIYRVSFDIRIIIYRVPFVHVSSISMQRLSYIHFSLQIAIIRHTRPPWADQNLVAVTERPNQLMETPLFWRKWRLFGISRMPMSGTAFNSHLSLLIFLRIDIPKSGGTTAKKIYECMGLALS
jgi:hypothetical protein